jgi:acyl-CoA reductase-like NAD-dependent aldehyde dehydrogenase
MTTGANLIAGAESTEGSTTFHAIDPRTGGRGATGFHEATPDEIASACAAAAEVAPVLARTEPAKIAALLHAIADGLESAGEDLIALADSESALGETRLAGERARTTGQLRAFAELVESGRHLEPVVDEATEARPDVRRMLVPIGPVAVFGASNFPLAFSVPGGDTASALGAGCPVVAKGHPSHPGTSELCARVIADAVRASGLPAGTFSMVQGKSADVGRALVGAPEIAAVAFTGSGPVGRALFDLAATRPAPIPVYAEMGSLNPVFVTSAALAARGESIADDLAASVLQGAGQFCTKPGLLFVPDDADGFIEALASRLGASDPQAMLNPGIRESFLTNVGASAGVPGVEVVVKGGAGDRGGTWTSPSLLATDLDAFIANEQLHEEHFGPATIVVRTPADRLVEAARTVPGSLTATVHAQPESDGELVDDLLAELTPRAGRIVFDGVPTGVAVVEAMQHGGPYPATTSSAHTSVGLFAIRRFLRPVAFQNAPARWLPEALRGEPR